MVNCSSQLDGPWPEAIFIFIARGLDRDEFLSVGVAGSKECLLSLGCVEFCRVGSALPLVFGAVISYRTLI